MRVRWITWHDRPGSSPAPPDLLVFTAQNCLTHAYATVLITAISPAKPLGSVSRSIGITRKRLPTVRVSCPAAVSIRYRRISARGSLPGTCATRCIRKPSSVSAYFRVGGGINGGTVASLFHMLETNQLAVSRDPFLLDPDPPAHTAEERGRNADPAGVRYDAYLKKWVGSVSHGIDQYACRAPHAGAPRYPFRLSGIFQVREFQNGTQRDALAARYSNRSRRRDSDAEFSSGCCRNPARGRRKRS